MTQKTIKAARFEPSTRTIRSVPENYWLASMDSWDGAVDHDAMALIFAAAPELLADARALLNTMETPRSDKASAAWYKLMQTIAKATGQAVQS